MPVRRFAAVDIAAPVMAHCTICSCEWSSVVSATAAPVSAPANALFFCRKKGLRLTNKRTLLTRMEIAQLVICYSSNNMQGSIYPHSARGNQTVWISLLSA